MKFDDSDWFFFEDCATIIEIGDAYEVSRKVNCRLTVC